MRSSSAPDLFQFCPRVSKILSFVIVMLLPFIYGYVFVRAYWDVFGRRTELPVAIVNEDVQGMGAVLTKTLIDEKVLKFSEENITEAQKDLEDKNIYAYIEFPANFSANLGTASGVQQVADIVFRPSHKANYPASQIVSRVLSTVRNEVHSGVVSEVAEGVLDNSKPLSVGAVSVVENVDNVNKLYTQTPSPLVIQQGVTQILQNEDYQKLVAGAKMYSSKSEELEVLSKNVMNPVEVVENPLGRIEYYGVYFVPLFISVGLWIGCLVTYVIFYFDQRHRFGIFDIYNGSWKQTIAYIVVALFLGPFTGAILLLLLWFPTTNVWLYFCSTIFTSVSFMCFETFFMRVFGEIGKFFVLILLVLQLGSCGGTFPPETIMPNIKWLHPILPMSYSVDLLRECVISRTPGLAGEYLLDLFLFALVPLVLTVAYDILWIYINKNRKKKQ